MNHVSLDDVPPDALAEGVERRALTDRLGTTDVAINRYRIAPGAGFPGGLHAHADQEEVFVVLEGAATFETLDGEVRVPAGEAVRFAPGEFQSGHNRGAAPLVALAIGAPRDSEDVRVPLDCPDCGHDQLRIGAADGAPRLVCPDCEATFVPEPCPDCGRGELEATLGEDGVVVTCPDCGATFSGAPLTRG